MKICTKCELELSFDEFYKSKQSKDGFEWHCKRCSYARKHAFWKKNPDRHRAAQKRYRDKHKEILNAKRREYYRKFPEMVRAGQLRIKFGIEPAEYERLLLIQQGRCCICNRTQAETGGKAFAVDHDHMTKQVRGLLCSRCNVGLGAFADSSELVQRALIYLERGIDAN